MNRTNIKFGPAILTYQGAVLYFKDGLSIDENVTLFDVNADALTGADKRTDLVEVTMTGTPVGAWKDLSVLFPWMGADMGASLHGATDSAAVVHFLDGDRFTYHNVGLRKMPDLMCAPTKTLLGEVEFVARTKNNTLASAANSLVTRDTASFTDDSFDWAEIPTLVFAMSYGDASPWDNIETKEGVTISHKTEWTPVPSANGGTLDERLSAYEATASFIPLGIAQSSIDARLATQGVASAMRGARRSEVAEDLVLSGSGVYICLRNGVLQKAAMKSGTKDIRQGALEVVSSLQLSLGQGVAQLVVDTAAP